MKNIQFLKIDFFPTVRFYLHKLDEKYPVLDVKRRWTEEWPSEKWNYQDNLMHLSPNSKKGKKSSKAKAPHPTKDESAESVEEAKITKDELNDFLTSIDGIGKKKVEKIVEHFGGVEEVVGVIHQNTSILTEVKGITKKLAEKIEKAWKNLLK